MEGLIPIKFIIDQLKVIYVIIITFNKVKGFNICYILLILIIIIKLSF
jgi:hypothetical protein